jgi:hypothetical protein
MPAQGGERLSDRCFDSVRRALSPPLKQRANDQCTAAVAAADFIGIARQRSSCA